MAKTAKSDAAHESNVKAGAVFAGRYRIVRPLGEGDRKRTYVAEDTVLGRKVALALIKEAAEGAPTGAMQEWRALAQTGNNENIVTLYDRGTAEGTDYLVFDYLAGGTLCEYFRKRADRDRPFSTDEVMKLGSDPRSRAFSSGPCGWRGFWRQIWAARAAVGSVTGRAARSSVARSSSRVRRPPSAGR